MNPIPTDAPSASAAQDPKDRVLVFDTTMRDGEQSPGASMSLEEKLELAKILEEMRVDVIEAGFPYASNGDFESVRQISEIVTESTICGLARAGQADIERCAEAIRPAKRGRIHTFISTSPVHMKWKLQMEPDAVLEMVSRSVSHARNLCGDVEWSAEDATRTERDFLRRCVEAAIRAGATTINIPDTVGYTYPSEYEAVFRDLIENVPSARLFDEMLKLLESGHALACLHKLRDEGLHHGVLPMLDVILEQPHGARFVEVALNQTDERVRAGKSVSPGFLFATLLWQRVSDRWEARKAQGEHSIPALMEAMDSVLDEQAAKLAIQRRHIADMREIWGLQPRLERTGRAAVRVIEHLRFRAGYDFMLLRVQAGELPEALGRWWTDFVEGDPTAREALLQAAAAEPRSGGSGTRRRRRRSGARRGPRADAQAQLRAQ